MFCAYGCAPCRKCPLYSSSISILTSTVSHHRISIYRHSLCLCSLYCEREGFFPLIFSLLKAKLSVYIKQNQHMVQLSCGCKLARTEEYSFHFFLIMFYFSIYLFFHSWLYNVLFTSWDWLMVCKMSTLAGSEMTFLRRILFLLIWFLGNFVFFKLSN